MRRKSFGLLISVCLFISSFYLGGFLVPSFGFNSKPYFFFLFVCNFIIFGLLIAFVIQKYFYPHKKKVFGFLFLLIILVFFLLAVKVTTPKKGEFYPNRIPTQNGLEADTINKY